MNFILKIIQGPNAGAEIALVAGTTVSFGSGEECDIVLGDQMLPEKVGELLVEENQVSLLLPDGRQEKLTPLQVKPLGTTAVAIGPAEGTWGKLTWPEDDSSQEPTALEEMAQASAEAQVKGTEPPKSRLLQFVLLFVLLAVVLLEFVIWFFWPQLNAQVQKGRERWNGLLEKWSSERKMRLAATPIRRQTLEELAKNYGVQAVIPEEDSQDTPKLKGNLRSRADRLQLTALAYNSFPGIEIELSDDESLCNSASELLNMVTEGKVKVAEAANRRLVLSGNLESPTALRRMLEAIQADVAFAESVDCSQVVVSPEGTAVAHPVAKAKTESAKPAVAPVVQPRLPVVGILLTPCPCLVMRDGSRVLEGGDFRGFTVEKITSDIVVLRHGENRLEWKP